MPKSVSVLFQPSDALFVFIILTTTSIKPKHIDNDATGAVIIVENDVCTSLDFIQETSNSRYIFKKCVSRNCSFIL